MQSGKYIVGSVDKNTGRFSASATPKEHMSLTIAKGEAARLAQENADKDFVVLKVEAIASVAKISWR